MQDARTQIWFQNRRAKAKLQDGFQADLQNLIHEDEIGFGFKMEVPFETIVDTVFTNAAPGSGLATFMLSKPPLFYLEDIGPDGTARTLTRHWKRCSDWTEGQQATCVLRHDLTGSAVQLAHLLRNLHTNSTSIPLRPPAYPVQSTTVATMELPPHLRRTPDQGLGITTNFTTP
ncbi:putative homeodomain containing protein [Lyophyllum shimeji]|uniref:Homeodomain containing protein n=1 Tax=Lyophyllum shimeji TaxID=47721 RepID=A0A9P3US50_LYOSH|nr:putative homeodomain containing protein [Lyophyllum shimeji]